MSDQLREIGDRIRARIPSGMSQRELARKADMTPDALSRALNAQRGFSAPELARIADVIDADTHWLITGAEDPHRIDVAARHGWDAENKRRVKPDQRSDDETLAKVAAAYRAAFPDGPPPSIDLPPDPTAVRGLLGDDFVRSFADRAEQLLGIDVVRLSGLSTDYSLRIGGRGVVLLATTPRWFRSNWSLAHEIGHLALGHHNGGAQAEANERPANEFAAELLLPRDMVAGQDWKAMTPAGLASFVWVAGVSTEALRHRLSDLRVERATQLDDSLELPSSLLLRRHLDMLRTATSDALSANPLTIREQDAAGHRFPVSLVTVLQERVESGEAPPELLAWALDVPLDEVDFPEPDDTALAEAYERMLTDRPSVADWRDRITQTEPPTR